MAREIKTTLTAIGFGAKEKYIGINGDYTNKTDEEGKHSLQITAHVGSSIKLDPGLTVMYLGLGSVDEKEPGVEAYT